jgi:hypothetical protein
VLLYMINNIPGYYSNFRGAAGNIARPTAASPALPRISERTLIIMNCTVSTLHHVSARCYMH